MNDKERLDAARDFVLSTMSYMQSNPKPSKEDLSKAIIRAAESLPPFTKIKKSDYDFS